MSKTEFNYSAKQESRQKLVNFVIRNYPNKERKGLKVACFPGAQAQDVYRITDVLGVPRKSVWGLERNKKIYKILESKNLGINLFQGTDEEFFSETEDNFDVVSLDYYGQIKENEINTLRHLFGREVLRPRGVLHTNFYGSRESGKIKKIYQKSGAYFKAMTEAMKDVSVEEAKKLIKEGKLRGLLEKSFDDYVINIKGLREGLTRAILNVAEKGKSSLETDNLDEVLYGPDKTARDLTLSGITYFLASYLSFKKSRPYFCDSLERYKYISDDGSPMLTDIFLFNQHRKWFDEREYPVTINSSNPGKLRVLVNNKPAIFSEELTSDVCVSRQARKDLNVLDTYHTPLEKKVINRAFDVYYYSGDLRQTDIIKERQFLGSSRKVEKETVESSLTKERAIELLKDGKSPEWIAQNYGANVHQLRAYKAWITMGKY